jgi:FkbM family methyltransferase
MILFLKLCFKGIYRFITDSGYRNFLLFALKYSGKKRNSPFPVKFKGHKIRVIDSLSFVWQYWDIFTEEFYYFESKTPVPVIFDVGSNIGMSIIYFKKIYPDSVIYGFEPDPRAYEALNENMNSFKFSAEDVIISKAAAWIHNDGTSLKLAGADSSYITDRDSVNSASEKVETVRLKEILERQKHIDFLKIDIEGAEVTVMQDCASSLKNIDRIFLEYHSFPDQSQDLDNLLSILKNAGFRIQINSPFRYQRPFLRRFLHPYPEMDMQLNIFAFRN